MPIKCDSREMVEFGFSDTNKEYKKILYLGTHITKMSLDAGFYYFSGDKNKNGGNPFWSIIKGIYNSKKLSKAIDDYKRALSVAKRMTIYNSEYRTNIAKKTKRVRQNLIDCLQKHGIVINDLIGYCECEGAEDDQINEDSVIPNDGNDNFHNVPSLMLEADLIVINGLGLRNNGEIKPLGARYFFHKFKFDQFVPPSRIIFVYGSSARGSNQLKIDNWLGKIKCVKK